MLKTGKKGRVFNDFFKVTYLLLVLLLDKR